MYQLSKFQFSKNFKFGVAEADLQVIGEKHTLKYENSLPTMWTHFGKNSPITYKQQTPLEGIDRYHKWKEDVTLMKNLGIKDYRTSVSMARLLTKDKKLNKKALEWYKQFFSHLKKNNIKIYATIYHWELPQFLSEQGGWKNRKTIDYVVEHAKLVYKHLGEFVEEYFILNEPVQSTFYSYHIGEQAPGEQNLKGALASVHHTLLAQGMVFNALRSMDKKIKLSTVYNPSTTYAISNSPEDIKAAKYAFGYHTAMFTDPLYLGKYPEYMMELFKDKMPKIENGDMDIIKVGKDLHAFGVNYYRAKTVRYDKNSEVRFEEVRFQHGIKNGMGRPVYAPPIYPEGFYDLLCELYNRYEQFGMKKIYITENGASWPDTVNKDGTIDDEFRIFYLKEHLRQMQKAILKGVPIEAFFVWTFIDNYNWSAGYRPESVYGLIAVDRPSLKRVPKESYYWYTKLIKTGILS